MSDTLDPSTPPVVALLGDLIHELRDPSAALREQLDRAATRVAGVLIGLEGRPLQNDPTAVAIALTVRVPGLPLLVTWDGERDYPYNAARRFLSLDHLSGARAGVVFTDGDSPTAQTLERIDVVRRLWNTWPVQTLVADRASGVYATTDGIHRLDHDGEFYRIAGPLNVPTSGQGEPVSVWHVRSQAELAAAHGLVDLVLTDEPALVSAWSSSTAADRPRLVTTVDAAQPPADTVPLVRVTTLHALADLLDATPVIPPTATLRGRLRLPSRTADLSASPLAFGAAS